MQYSDSVQVEPKQISNQRRVFSNITTKLSRNFLRSATSMANPFHCSNLYHMMSTFACPLPFAIVVKGYMLCSKFNLKTLLSSEQNLCSFPPLFVSSPAQIQCVVLKLMSRSPLAVHSHL